MQSFTEEFGVMEFWNTIGAVTREIKNNNNDNKNALPHSSLLHESREKIFKNFWNVDFE